MPRYALETVILFLACCAIGYSQVPVEHFRPRPAPVAPHNFGVDQDRLGREPVDIRLPEDVRQLLAEWYYFPRRVENALTWATFGTGFACGMIVSISATLAFVVAGRNRNV